MTSVKRYTPTLDWGCCYYEGDQPNADMQETTHGEWVALADYEALHKANKYLVDVNEQLFADVKKLQQNNSALFTLTNALQAKIDALMLEFTPDEMTPDQLRKWSEHQRPV